MSIQSLRLDLHSLANPQKAKFLQRYFKTGKGQYAEGDVFLGITVPEQRKIAKKYFKELSLQNIQELLNSKFHEERFTALEILNFKYKKSENKYELVEFYLKNLKNINNWDLVDTSAPYILGEFLFNGDKSILHMLARSKNIWERRIAIVSTFAFIKKRKFGETLVLAEILLKDEHDLIQKAVGWMLREIGKRDVKVLEIFLKSRYKEMPRTMLHYAIEKFPEDTRKAYLKGKIN